MTSNYYQTKIKSLNADISNLEKKVNDEQKKIDSAESTILKDEIAINKSNLSQATVRLKQKEIQRKRNDIVSCRKKMTEFNTKLIKKKQELVKVNEDYNKALAHEHQAAQRKAELNDASFVSHDNYNSVLHSIFQNNDYPLIPNQTFVISPFTDDISNFYRQVLKPAVESISGMICLRADDIYTANVVMEDVWKLICESPIIIADLTGRNANVFYEIGLAHAIGKKVIIMSQNIDDIPFDLRALRCIKYSLRDEDFSVFQDKLVQTITTVLEEAQK